MKWVPLDGNARPGDMIRVKIGAIYHYGVYVSENEIIQFGDPPRGDFLTRDQTLIEVCSIDCAGFSAGGFPEIAKLSFKERRARLPRARTVSLARSRIGETGYHLLHNNCEHFANECVMGVHRSLQEEEAKARWVNRPRIGLFFVDGCHSGKGYLRALTREAVSEYLNVTAPRAGLLYLPRNRCFKVRGSVYVCLVPVPSVPDGITGNITVIAVSNYPVSVAVSAPNPGQTAVLPGEIKPPFWCSKSQKAGGRGFTGRITCSAGVSPYNGFAVAVWGYSPEYTDVSAYTAEKAGIRKRTDELVLVTDTLD